MSTQLNEITLLPAAEDLQLLASLPQLLETVLTDLRIGGSVTATRAAANSFDFDVQLPRGTKIPRVSLLVDDIARFMEATAGTVVPIDETVITIRLLMRPYIDFAPEKQPSICHSGRKPYAG